MRHDTVSSYLAGHTDGARVLVICLTMTTWAVLAVDLLEFQIVSFCAGSAESWVSTLEILGCMALTLTFCVPGGKFYVVAVRAYLELSNTGSTPSGSRRVPLYGSMFDMDSVVHAGEPDLPSDDVRRSPTGSAAISLAPVPIEVICAYGDDQTIPALGYHQAQARQSLRVRMLLPPEDAFFADGHSGVFCCIALNSRNQIQCINLSHGIGMVVWLVCMTAPQFQLISDSSFHSETMMVLSSVGLALGWACFIFFQFYTQCVINRQISMEVESDDFARQFVAPSGDPRFRDIQTSFRLAVGMELMAILCILGAALLRSYAFVKKASCVGMVTS